LIGSLLTILVGLAVVCIAPLSGAPSRPGQPEHARAAFSPRPRHGLGHHRQAVQTGRSNQIAWFPFCLSFEYPAAFQSNSAMGPPQHEAGEPWEI
jgi:hypothetical protein